MSSEDSGMVEILDSNGNGQNVTDTHKRNTTSLELSPDEIEKAEIARNQLLNLTKKSAKKKSSPETSEEGELGAHKMKPEILTSPSTKPTEPFTEVIYDGKPTMGNLSSAIISKEELEDEIRKKIAIKGEKRKSYDIEIPQELILSEVTVQPSTSKDEQSQLDGQELIDILEGNGDAETDTYEVIGENGVFVVKAADQETSYEIVSPEEQIKKKVIERQIAMQQIASMPVRRHRRSNPVSAKTSPAPRSAQPSLAQSLAMDWSDKEEEVILEVENMKESNEPKIKILNMTILNESASEHQKISKPEPKILNINAPSASPPKILNKMAPQVQPTEPASFKRSRVVKKKQIWDPSESPTQTTLSTEKKSEKVPITLPSTITIKKVTKETIAKEQPVVTKTKTTPSPARKGKKKSEIERLFQDEGAINMIYSLERQNNNQDVPELKIDSNDTFIDKSEEKSTLIAKQKTIRDTIIKQSTSPNESKNISTRPQRVKRDLTPSKPVEPPKVIEKTPEKTVTVIKAHKVTPASRKKKIDDSWDFVRNAQTTCEDAMIIRRHSNSSYSSSAPTSPRRLSVDQSMNDSGENFKMPKDRKSTDAPKDLKSSVGGLVEELRNTLSTKLAKGKTPPVRGRKRAAATIHENAKKRNLGSEFDLTKIENVAHIIVSSEVFTLSLLESIKSTLTQLENDSTCKIVLFTASEGFSKGLDYSSLVQTTVDKRKQAASDLVTAVKNFFMSLATFPKTLICGLKGLTSGICVSMLPLFDIVIADNTSKFSLPHVQIGCNPEGISILQTSNKINSSVITQLFLLHETLDAKTALQSGLISKIVTGNIDDDQLREICKQISLQSSQAMESTKKLLNEDFLDTIDHRLTKEVKILQAQWISVECQEKFKIMSV